MAKVLDKTTTIKIPQKALKKGVVLLEADEYKDLRECKDMFEKIVPTYQLTGKAAERLDKLVKEGMREHKEGKTISASSMREALKIYEGRKNKKN